MSTITDQMPSLGGATEWLESEPLGPAGDREADAFRGKRRVQAAALESSIALPSTERGFS